MHLLYVDESGHPDDPNQDWFILAGVSIFEREGYWHSKALDDISRRFPLENGEERELHAAEMRNGRRWYGIDASERVKAIEDVLKLTKASKTTRLFAVAVQKGSVTDKDPIEYAFMQLVSRFDHYLRRLFLMGEKQRGMVIFDQKPGERRIQELAREFRTKGHDWGILQNLAEVPVFMDSRASRMLQMADIVAYSIYRFLQNNDDKFFRIIEREFDHSGGVQHGLHVKRRPTESSLETPY